MVRQEGWSPQAKDWGKATPFLHTFSYWLLKVFLSSCKKPIPKVWFCVEHFVPVLFADDNLVFCKANKVECLNLNKLLKKFEEAYGECVNISKFVEVVKEIWTYLGLPSSFSRSKADDFKYIPDKVNKIFQG